MEVFVVLHPMIQKWGRRCIEFSKEKKKKSGFPNPGVCISSLYSGNRNANM